MQRAMTELTKSIDAQQQGLAAGLSTFARDVHANWAEIMINGPHEMADARTADSTALHTPGGFYVR
jgi:hypothetical protein